MVIDDSTLLRLRWRALLLHDDVERDVTDVVDWFGAVQAQDVRHGQWAIGARSASLTRADVQAAHRDRRIVRTWVMRGTLHVVPAADAGWMVEHLARRQRPAIVTRLAKMGVNAHDADRAVEAVVSVLADGSRTRTVCRATVAEVLGAVGAEAARPVVELAALDAAVVPEPIDGGEPSFALLATIVPVSRRLDRAEALATIARRYVRGHGPVTARDLARWTGITLTDARWAIAELGDELVTRTWNDTTVHLTRELADSPLGPDGPARLLPGFDEHVIGYASRQPTVPVAHDGRIVPGGNGIYRPTIAAAGRTLGTWTATRHGAVEAAWFDDADRRTLDRAIAAWQRFGGRG